jgi:hypothetical protein
MITPFKNTAHSFYKKFKKLSSIFLIFIGGAVSKKKPAHSYIPYRPPSGAANGLMPAVCAYPPLSPAAAIPN